MLQFLSQNSKELVPFDPHKGIDPDAVWYDLNQPSEGEMALMQRLGVQIPTLAEMSEIEESSRLYEEGGLLYMTTFLIACADSDSPVSVPVTFILTPKCVVTVRYVDLKVFQLFTKKVLKNGFVTPHLILAGMLDTLVERLADILEMNATEIEKMSDEIFKGNHPSDSAEMRQVLINLGKVGNLNSKVRESLMTLDRLLIFSHNQLERGDSPSALC